MGWFREFLPNYANYSKELYEALKKNKKWEWSVEMDKEYIKIKTH
jgi:hypothetical protein